MTQLTLRQRFSLLVILPLLLIPIRLSKSWDGSSVLLAESDTAIGE